MEVKCPYCGDSNFDCFALEGGGGDNIIESCVCDKCGKIFSLYYDFKAIKKESEQKMNFNYELIDDPLCDLDETIECYDDCKECPYFYDCYQEVSD